MSNKKIELVVEDDKDQNELICEQVREAGYEVLNAFDGYQALEILRKHRRGFGFLTNKISCILLDWNMPKMSGMDFLKIIRKEERFRTFRKYIPVVFLTAYDEDDKRSLASNTKIGMAAGYLTKPFDKRELHEILSRITEDNDTEILIEHTRDQNFRKPVIDKDRITREDYYLGKKNEKALGYLKDKIKQLDKEYNEAIKMPNSDQNRVKFITKMLSEYKLELENEKNSFED